MKKAGIICLLAVGSFMTMCTVQRPVERSFPTPEPPVRPTMTFPPAVERLGYTGASEPMFYYIEGLKASKAMDNHVLAARLFDKAIETDSTHSPSYFAAANNIAICDPELALDYSLTANRLDSTNIWYKTQLARLYVLNSRYDEALEEYTRLLNISPDNPDNYNMLAALYDIKRQPFAAIAILNSAEARFGRMEEITEAKRDFYLKMKMFDQAIEESLGMIDEYPYNYRNYLIAGELYLMKGRDSLGKSYLEKAAAINPTGPDVLANLANYYRMADDNVNFFAVMKDIMKSKDVEPDIKTSMFKEITSDMQFYSANYFRVSELALALRSQYPDDYDIMELYASTLFAAGQTDAGLNVYKNYIRDTTSITEPFIFILEVEAYLGRIDSMNKYSQMAIERFPDNAELYLRRGSALAYMERTDEALEIYRRTMKLVDTDSMRAVVYGNIADTYHQIKKDNKAFANYDKALKLNPDNVLALNNYAYFLSLTGKKLDKALTMAERVMELEPNNSTYIDTYGWVLYKLGRYEEAKKVLQQAVSLDRSASKELLLHYGDILYELDEYFMAKYYWEKALDAGYDKDDIESRMKKIE